MYKISGKVLTEKQFTKWATERIEDFVTSIERIGADNQLAYLDAMIEQAEALDAPAQILETYRNQARLCKLYKELGNIEQFIQSCLNEMKEKYIC